MDSRTSLLVLALVVFAATGALLAPTAGKLTKLTTPNLGQATQPETDDERMVRVNNVNNEIVGESSGIMEMVAKIKDCITGQKPKGTNWRSATNTYGADERLIPTEVQTSEGHFKRMVSSVYKSTEEVRRFIEYHRKVCRAKGIIAKEESFKERFKVTYAPNHYFHKLLEEDITPDQYFDALKLKSLIGGAKVFSNTVSEKYRQYVDYDYEYRLHLRSKGS
uniref:RxLR effector protein n=1 Tax=Peronospora matthiolae TaxID=2874970 RepID=A0AAV1TQQ1_9STRA